MATGPFAAYFEAKQARFRGRYTAQRMNDLSGLRSST